MFAVAQELKQLGLLQHDIRQETSRAVAGQLWYMEKEGCVFDEGRYLVDLQEIVEAHRQDGAGLATNRLAVSVEGDGSS